MSSSQWNISPSVNVSSQGCPSSLIPWHSTPLSSITTSVSSLQNPSNQLCVSGCCVPCGFSHAMAPTVEHLQETFVVLAYFAFLFSLFLIVSHLVNSRLTINAYTTLQSTAIVIFSIPFSFFLINAKQTVCYDSITLSSGQSNGFCLAQGFLFVLGFHAVALSLLMRTLSIYFLVVRSKTIPRVYPTIFTLGVSVVFAAASVKHIVYEGGIFCAPSRTTTKPLLQIPLIIYSSVGLLLSLGTTISVTKSLLVIKTNIHKSHFPSSLSANVTNTSNSSNHSGPPPSSSSSSSSSTCFSSTRSIPKLQLVKMSISAYLNSAKLLWRTYVMSLFFGAVMVFVAIQYTLSTRSGSLVNDRLATPDWIRCILSYHELHATSASTTSNSSTSPNSGTSTTVKLNSNISSAATTKLVYDACSPYLTGQPIYIRTLTTIILLQLFTVLFLITEYRLFLFRAWCKMLRNPAALFNKKKSNELLDTLDDSLEKVWLPEKLQHGFLGNNSNNGDHDCYNNETQRFPLFSAKRWFNGSTSSSDKATQTALENQLLAFAEAHEQERRREERVQAEVLKEYPEWYNVVMLQGKRGSVGEGSENLDRGKEGDTGKTNDGVSGFVRPTFNETSKADTNTSTNTSTNNDTSFINNNGINTNNTNILNNSNNSNDNDHVLLAPPIQFPTKIAAPQFPRALRSYCNSSSNNHKSLHSYNSSLHSEKSMDFMTFLNSTKPKPSSKKNKKTFDRN